MDFQNAFDVAVTVDAVYDALLDLERVVPCLPGAEVLGHDGDSLSVMVKVRVGATSLQYRAGVSVVGRDDRSHRASLAIRARETRGQGTADATAQLQLEPHGAGTHVQLSTELKLTGKVATMGRGIIAAVSEHLVEQFSRNLFAMLESADPSAGSPPGLTAVT
ncbi:MAG TPA: SRPBCC family protein [Solirubrobacteraceae bacterium]|nr:SRPBCC family protein [Solirubrobacteraceae bacterium]